MSRIDELRAGLASVRSRFGYSSLAVNELQLAKQTMTHSPPIYLSKLSEHSLENEDAFHTMLRFLLYRAANRKYNSKRVNDENAERKAFHPAPPASAPR